jgi:hypothetical protein
VSTLMAKDCDNLSPSPDLQAIAITPGALLSPSLSKTKTRPPVPSWASSTQSLRSPALNLFFFQKILALHPFEVNC